MSEKISNIIKEFQDEIKLYPTGKENLQGIEDLYSAIQLIFEGGEDILSD